MTTYRLYYGWYVLIASFLMLSVTSAAQFSIGVMFKPIISDFGWNRADLSMAVFVNMTVFAFSMLAIGRAYDRFGPKWVIILCAICTGAGFLGLSQMTSLAELLIYYGFFCGIGFSGTTVLIFTSLISKWFDKRRGLAIGLGLSGGRLGQFFLIPIMTALVIDQGWQLTYAATGIAVLVVNVGLTLWIVRGDPDSLGIEIPESEKRSASSEPDPGVSTALLKPADLSLGEVAKTRSFWIYLFVMFVCGAGDFFVATHLVPFVTDHGVSQTTAGNMLAWLGLFSLVGALLAGMLSDWIGNKALITGTFVLRMVLFILIIKYQNTVSFYLFSLGFGFTMMVTAVLTVTLIGKMYGFSHIGTLTGVINTVHHMAGGLLVYLGGAVFDRMESYKSVFLSYAVFSALATIGCILIREERHEPPS